MIVSREGAGEEVIKKVSHVLTPGDVDSDSIHDEYDDV